jgi:hypothetical protein
MISTFFLRPENPHFLHFKSGNQKKQVRKKSEDSDTNRLSYNVLRLTAGAKITAEFSRLAESKLMKKC